MTQQDQHSPAADTVDGRDRTRTVTARPPLAAWRTNDLMAAAMLGVAIGVAFWGWDVLYGVLSPATKAFPPAAGLLGGPWLLGGVIGMLVVRRPGAALLTELVAANVEYLLGNEWGVTVLVSGTLQGLGVELVVAAFLWRRFGWRTAALAAAAAALLEAVYEWFFYWSDWTWSWRLVYGAAFILSGAIVAGIGGWALVRALARTGALGAFPPGQEEREARAV